MFDPNPCRGPLFIIDPDAWDKLLTYVDLALPHEINGYALLTRLEGFLAIASPDDVFITDQVVTAGAADVSEGNATMALYHATMAGRNDDLRMQWHSHGYGDAYFSQTDMSNIERAGNAGGATWTTSMVLNSRGNHVVRLDQFLPFRIGIPLQVRIQRLWNPELRTACAAEVQEKVQIKEFVGKGRKAEEVIRPIDLGPAAALVTQ